MYTKVVQKGKDETCWYGWFQEMPEYMTNGEEDTIESTLHWLDLLLDDLRVWASEGVIPPLPPETDNGIINPVIIHYLEWDMDNDDLPFTE